MNITSNTEIQIIDGKYLVFSEANSSNIFIKYPELIKNEKTFSVKAYSLVGCGFPYESNPHYNESISLLKNYLSGKEINIVIDNNKSYSPISKIIKRKTSYRHVLGVVFNGDTRITPDGQFVNLMLPINPSDSSQIYFINDNKLYFIKENGLYGDYVKYSIYGSPLESDVSIQNENISLDIDAITKTTIDRLDLNSHNEKVITVNVVYTNNYNIQLVDILTGGTSISQYLLQNGLSHFTQEYSPKTDIDITKFTNMRIYQHAAYSSKLGMWTFQYWQKFMRLGDGTEEKISYSSFDTFLSCQYKYFRSKLDKKSGNDVVDFNDGDDQKAAILGIIIHYYSALINTYLVNGGSKTDSIITTYKQAAVKNWINGSDVSKIKDFTFTSQDIQSIDIEYRRKNITTIEECLNNVANRNYIKSNNVTVFDSEFELTLPALHMVQSGDEVKYYNIIGYVDGISANATTAYLYDFKSNNAYENGEYTQYNINKSAHYHKLAQLVFYAYFLIKRGGTDRITIPFRKPGNLIATTEQEIRDILLDESKIVMFYDLVRYDENIAVVNINSELRAKLLDYILDNFKKLTSSLVQYQTGRIALNSISATASQDNCKYCVYKSSCDTKQESTKIREAFNDLPQNSLRSAFTGYSRLSGQFEDSINGELVNIYYRLSNGEILEDDNIKKLNDLKKKNNELYSSRKKLIDIIDNDITMQICSIYLSSAVTSIQIGISNRHEFSDTLRTLGPTVNRSSSAHKEIVVSIRFDSAEKINSELRHILAQYRAFPFINIKNSDLTRSVLPFDVNKKTYIANSDAYVVNLVKQYEEKKRGDALDTGDDYKSASSIKNEIYKNTRLYYSIDNLYIEDVPNFKDTVDLVLVLSLADVTISTTRGFVEYLTDTNAVLLQHANELNARLSNEKNDVQIAIQELLITDPSSVTASIEPDVASDSNQDGEPSWKRSKIYKTDYMKNLPGFATTGNLFTEGVVSLTDIRKILVRMQSVENILDNYYSVNKFNNNRSSQDGGYTMKSPRNDCSTRVCYALGWESFGNVSTILQGLLKSKIINVKQNGNALQLYLVLHKNYGSSNSAFNHIGLTYNNLLYSMTGNGFLIEKIGSKNLILADISNVKSKLDIVLEKNGFTSPNVKNITENNFNISNENAGFVIANVDNKNTIVKNDNVYRLDFSSVLETKDRYYLFFNLNSSLKYSELEGVGKPLENDTNYMTYLETKYDTKTGSFKYTKITKA